MWRLISQTVNQDAVRRYDSKPFYSVLSIETSTVTATNGLDLRCPKLFLWLVVKKEQIIARFGVS